MITIRTFTDLDAMLADNTISNTLAGCVKNHFMELFREQNHDGLPPEAFSLDPHNTLFIAESGDQLFQRLIDAPFGPEFVDRIVFPDEIIFRVGILMDNDWLTQHFISARSLEERTLRWLVAQSGFGGSDNE